MTQQTKNNPQTPLEKLISDKQRIQQECQIKAGKLNDDFAYIQENAGSLLLSGLSSLLFPSTKPTSQKEATEQVPVSSEGSSLSLGLTEYLSIAKGMLPLAWDLAQPFIMSWGIKKAKKWLISIFSKKKK